MTKVLVGGLFVLLSFILIGIPFLIGYALEVIRRAQSGDPQPLPDWSDLGGYFSDGIKLTAVVIVYALPIIVVGCLAGLMGAAVGNSSQGGGGGAGLIAFCLNCIIFLWGLVMAVFLPAAMVSFAETGELMSTFRVGKLWSFIRNNLGNYIIAIVLGWVASLVASFGFILCGVGILFTTFWGYMVQAHLLGQVARAAQPALSAAAAPESY
ncbi:MAG: DUF4013 domain-containing protein [Chloroflexi bacterium]|nr:DUF4013 domain-containing protein [Chloroflexota bacterium]